MRCIVEKFRASSNSGIWVVIAPVVAHSKDVALGYYVRKITAGCLVLHIQATRVPYPLTRTRSVYECDA